jgi:membrane protein DedA with SNARE-associated domain
MKISKFLKYSVLGGLVWSSLLVITGYFFGYAADKISEYIKYAGYFILIGAILVFIGIIFYKKKQTKEILE